MFSDRTRKRAKSLGWAVGLGLVVLWVATATVGGAPPGPRDSYFFVPGNHGVLHGATEEAFLRHWGQGDVSIYATKDGEKEIVFPLALLGIFVADPVELVEVAFSFKTWGELTRITRVRVYRTKLDGSYRTILDERPAEGWTDPEWRVLTFPITSDDLIAVDDGQVAVRVTCFIPEGQRVEFTGVRLRVK